MFKLPAQQLMIYPAIAMQASSDTTTLNFTTGRLTHLCCQLLYHLQMSPMV